jgi:hypothetical protein
MRPEGILIPVAVFTTSATAFSEALIAFSTAMIPRPSMVSITICVVFL